MKLKLYSVRDIVTGEFDQPTMMHNDEQAKRSLANAVNSANNLAATNFADLQLFKIGEIDTETGEIASKVEMIATGISLKRE